jgi:hypothetical protein
MALTKVNYNSINVTAASSKAIKFNSSNNGFETGDVGGNLILLSTQTASSSSTISFTSNIDSTYKEYIFKFYDLNPGTDASYFQFQADTGTNTSYNQTMTTTWFNSYHNEADSGTNLGYSTGDDQAQGTSFQSITGLIGNGADESGAGILHIFDPSNSTFTKHYMSRMQYLDRNDASIEIYSAGYFNTTTALTRFQFKFHQGNFDGVIKLYGVL